MQRPTDIDFAPSTLRPNKKSTNINEYYLDSAIPRGACGVINSPRKSGKI